MQTDRVVLDTNSLLAALFTGHTTTLTDEELDQMKYEYLAEKYL